MTLAPCPPRLLYTSVIPTQTHAHEFSFIIVASFAMHKETKQSRRESERVREQERVRECQRESERERSKTVGEIRKAS